MTTIGCHNNKNTNVQKPDADSSSKGTFGYDLSFLKQHDSNLVVLTNDGETAEVIVSPKYQAKVFTSTADGLSGKSFGWINYKAFAAPVNEHMNAYGGENRFWLGPEGGTFSLYFDKEKDMVFDNWKTPAAIDTESWNVIAATGNSVHLQKEMNLTNYAGTKLTLIAGRDISILTRDKISSQIGIELGDDIKSAGYLTSNTITNTGDFNWTEKTGMPCIWMLDMFNPSPKTTVVVPYKKEATGKIATTDYFGEIAKDRINYKNGTLLFKADGKSRGKLGIAPGKAKPMAGSYDAENGILTIVIFDIDPNGKYLNQEWNTTRPVFSGDAVNAYNDGALADGTQMGPFYEIESVSPAAFLKKGEMMTHNHYVFHFSGQKEKLNQIATKVLGISTDEIQQAF